MARKFYLEHDIEVNGKKIKILGITHGDWRFPLGRKTAKIILDKKRENSKTTTYHEGPLPDPFLPKQLRYTALSLEPYSEIEKNRPLWKKALAQYPGYSAKEKLQLLLAWTRELIGVPEKIPEDIGKLSERNRFRRSISGENAPYAAAYIVGYRSLEMADKLLESPHKHILAVMGAAHAPLVKKFLENPKLRERYRRLWEKATP